MMSARTLAVMALLAFPGALAVSATSNLPAPPDIKVRIVGTASFQGRQTALIEDRNTLTDSFYRVGDPIYGYKITSITSDGIFLDKGSKKFFVAFEPSSVRARGGDADNKVVVANTYLPTNSSSVVPNFYTDVPHTTQWDLWTERPSQAVADSRPVSPATAVASAAVGVGGRFVFPIATYKRMSSGFGYRKHPIGGGTKMHKGIDLSAKTGTKIFAADAGRVVFAGWKGGYGYCVEIDHLNGYRTLYGHCSKLIADVGDNVKRGEYVAAVGSTGASTGPHLHFEVHRNGTAIDPSQFFKNKL